jgi:hypothetical protein
MATMLSKNSSLPRRRLVAALLAWSGLAATAHGQSVEADMPAARVTSDTPEFCAHLAEMLRQEMLAPRPGPVPDEVLMLAHEGRKMCGEGHVRPGILRIRRALLILKGE